MDTHIIDGRQIAADLCTDLAKRIVQLPFRPPSLKVLLVGDDPASLSYVRNKSRTAKSIGIDAEIIRFPAHTIDSTLIALIHDLNQDRTVDGIMVQLPLPAHIATHHVVNAINPAKDVDGLAPHNASCNPNLGFYTPCTPMGIMKLLAASQTALRGAKALMVGNGMVGRPMAALLSQSDATVTMTNLHTRDLAAECRHADIIIVAVGHLNLIRGAWIKPGAVIIDVGYNRTASGIAGDVAYDECLGIARAISPVPGGVGPMTIACLLENTIEATRHSMVIQLLQA